MSATELQSYLLLGKSVSVVNRIESLCTNDFVSERFGNATKVSF